MSTDSIPVTDLIALIRRLRAEAAQPPALRDADYRVFYRGVCHGMERAAGLLADLLDECGFAVEAESEVTHV